MKKKALATGASGCHVVDLREEFVRDFVFPALRADAAYEQDYLMGTSLARPIIAKAQMEVVKKEGADAVAHGSTGKGNDQVRFELGYYHFDPHIQIIAPWRIWDLKSRSRADSHIPRSIRFPSRRRRKSLTRSIATCSTPSYEGGILEDPWKEPDAAIFQLTRESRRRAEHAALRRGRDRGRHAGGHRRRAAVAGGAARPRPTRSPASTASGASTSSRIATSA